MAEREERRTVDPDGAAACREDDGTTLAREDGRPAERAAITARHGIEQVADKVKGILRSDR